MKVKPRRLFSYPRVAVRRVEQGDGGATCAVLSIDGLVCDVCAARTRRALTKLPGAAAAEVDLESGSATVRFEGQAASEDTLAQAVDRQVVLRPARRWLARLRRRWISLWPMRRKTAT